MELTSFNDCLKLAKTVTPEALGDVQQRLYTAATELALTQAEVEQLLKALKDSTGVTLGSLKADFADFLKAHGLAAEKDSTATEIIKLALDAGVELWHDPEGNPWATLHLDNHLEHHPLKTKPVRRYLGRLYYEAKETAAHSQGLQDALGVLEAKAAFEGQEQDTFIRVAEVDGRVYLDLANDGWKAVEVTATGWRILDSKDVPVRFRRSKGTRPLPTPITGGNLDALAELLNLEQNGDDLKLVTAWLLAALRGKGPYPVLTITGEQGSGKSTASKILRRIIDPNTAPLRTLSRDERDMLITATNSWIIAYNNLSGVSNSVSDSLCRLADGAGMATRELYSDQDEAIFNAARPILLNGIGRIIERPDLADRALQVNLPRIPRDKRKTDTELNDSFEAVWPGVLGSLLDVVSAGLARLPRTTLDYLPRMADFATWITACEGALGWQPGDFMKAFDDAQANLVEDALEAEPIADYLMELANRGEWTGTATELLERLNATAGHTDRRRTPKSWPTKANFLSSQLHRIAPALRSAGYEVEELPREGKRRLKLWRIRTVPQIIVPIVRTDSEESRNLDTDDETNRNDDSNDDGTSNGGIVPIVLPPFAQEQRQGRNWNDANDANDEKTPHSKHDENEENYPVVTW